MSTCSPDRQALMLGFSCISAPLQTGLLQRVVELLRRGFVAFAGRERALVYGDEFILDAGESLVPVLGAESPVAGDVELVERPAADTKTLADGAGLGGLAGEPAVA